jgi:hypothetical protein
MKQIIVDIDQNGEIQIITKGYTGVVCLEETQFLKDLLGKEIARELAAVACVHEDEEAKQHIPICG